MRDTIKSAISSGLESLKTAENKQTNPKNSSVSRRGMLRNAGVALGVSGIGVTASAKGTTSEEFSQKYNNRNEIKELIDEFAAPVIREMQEENIGQANSVQNIPALSRATTIENNPDVTVEVVQSSFTNERRALVSLVIEDSEERRATVTIEPERKCAYGVVTGSSSRLATKSDKELTDLQSNVEIFTDGSVGTQSHTTCGCDGDPGTPDVVCGSICDDCSYDFWQDTTRYWEFPFPNDDNCTCLHYQGCGDGTCSELCV